MVTIRHSVLKYLCITASAGWNNEAYCVPCYCMAELLLHYSGSKRQFAPKAQKAISSSQEACRNVHLDAPVRNRAAVCVQKPKKAAIRKYVIAKARAHEKQKKMLYSLPSVVITQRPEFT